VGIKSGLSHLHFVRLLGGAMSLFVRKSAIISKCGLFRYELRREWDDSLPPYVSGMLNPSTADHELDDPTIARNIGRAERHGCGSLIVWNLGAGRATDPQVWKTMADPIGPNNDGHIERILTECHDRSGIAVAGWGNDGSFMGRDKAALRIAAKVGITFQCVAMNKGGQPRHPLYSGYGSALIPWSCGQR
jgi:hypothetical protein